MSAVKEEFLGIFRGGKGPNNNTKWSLVQCQLLTDNRSKYKFLGQKKLSALWNGDWLDGPTHLDTEDYMPIDVYIGGDFVTARIYNISLQREIYYPDEEHLALSIRNDQLQLERIKLVEMLSSMKSKIHDSNNDDLADKREIDRTEHYKTVRSNLTYTDMVGRGLM